MNTPEQCCFAAAAESPVPRCEKPATRKWGGIWFCDEHGSRSMPVPPAGKPAGPEWTEIEDSAATRFILKTPAFDMAVCESRRGCWLASHAAGDFPTREAAQQAAVARAVELVEGTLAILKP